jgi:hypothetical protein
MESHEQKISQEVSRTCPRPFFPVRDNERAESSFLKTRKLLLNIARVWRERADKAEKKIKRQRHCRIGPAA